MAEVFTFLKDSAEIPVCAYQIGANALSQILFVPVKVTDEVQTTDGSGFFQCDYYPVLDINGDGALTAADVLPRNNGSGVALYVGTAAADLDSNAGKFKLYSDAGLTTPVTATACKCTYYYAVPVSVDSNGRLLIDVNSSALPTGAATDAKLDTLIAKDFATQTTLAALLAKIIAAPSTEAQIGEVQVSPTTNTLLDRLKTLATLIGEVQASPTENTVLDRLKDLLTGIALAASTNVIGKIRFVNSDDSREAYLQGSLGDEETFVNSLATTAFMLQYNGSTYERRRSNLQGILLASAARTETQTGTDETNYNGRGIHVILDVTAITDTPSIVLKIEGKSASGVYYTLLEGSAITGTGTYVYKVMPSAISAANEAASDFLPRTWRVVVTHADADSITYSLDYATDC